MAECGYQKINFDASFLIQYKVMSIGLIMFSDTWNCGGSISISGVSQDGEQTEASTTLKATNWLKKLMCEDYI